MLLLNDVEQQAQNLTRQDKLKLFQFLEQDLFRKAPANGTAQKPDADTLELTEAPEGYEIQTPWSAYDAYDAAANLKAWMDTLPGPKRLDPDKLIYDDETIIDLTHQ